jgi:hypothetical protein
MMNRDRLGRCFRDCLYFASLMLLRWGGFVGKSETIREKKDRSKELTFRCMPMSPFLRVVMHDWLKRHPGVQLTICSQPNLPLTAQLAAHHFRWAVDGSKWEVLKGWHALRHSFASNCAAKCVDAYLTFEAIDGFGVL